MHVKIFPFPSWNRQDSVPEKYFLPATFPYIAGKQNFLYREGVSSFSCDERGKNFCTLQELCFPATYGKAFRKNQGIGQPDFSLLGLEGTCLGRVAVQFMIILALRGFCDTFGEFTILARALK